MRIFTLKSIVVYMGDEFESEESISTELNNLNRIRCFYLSIYGFFAVWSSFLHHQLQS